MSHSFSCSPRSSKFALFRRSFTSLATGRSCSTPWAWQADPSHAQHPWWDSPHHVDCVGASPTGWRPRRRPWNYRDMACVAWEEGQPLPLTCGAGWLSSEIVDFWINSAECSKIHNKSTKNGKNAKPILLGSLAPDLQWKNIHACTISFLPCLNVNCA